jgi:predicted RNA-binding Zn ribbon-like protein
LRAPRYDVPKAAPQPLRLVQQLVNTTDHEHGREWLGSPVELERWLRDLGLPAGKVNESDVRRARELREALRELLIANNTGTETGGPALAVLNEAAMRARLGIEFGRSAVAVIPHNGGVDGALGRILAAAATAVLDGSWERLKACRNCEWAFYDFSRNRSATWCSMQLCGNRLKTRTYRRRRARHG